MQIQGLNDFAKDCIQFLFAFLHSAPEKKIFLL